MQLFWHQTWMEGAGSRLEVVVCVLSGVCLALRGIQLCVG